MGTHRTVCVHSRVMTHVVMTGRSIAGPPLQFDPCHYAPRRRASVRYAWGTRARRTKVPARRIGAGIDLCRGAFRTWPKVMASKCAFLHMAARWSAAYQLGRKVGHHVSSRFQSCSRRKPRPLHHGRRGMLGAYAGEQAELSGPIDPARPSRSVIAFGTSAGRPSSAGALTARASNDTRRAGDRQRSQRGA
jgi:hypothetical protein